MFDKILVPLDGSKYSIRAQEIVKTAKEGKFDLIVMGSRGVSKIKRDTFRKHKRWGHQKRTLPRSNNKITAIIPNRRKEHSAYVPKSLF